MCGCVEIIVCGDLSCCELLLDGVFCAIFMVCYVPIYPWYVEWSLVSYKQMGGGR